MNRIYVTGHRNPDTDSIAAAISYAALRNALGNRDYVAAHLGHISDETKRLLDRFGFQEPVTISNVRTQVRDLDFDTPPTLNSSVTMDRAWHIMRDQNISAMPIINEDGTLYGMLSAGDIAAYSMRTISDRHVDALPLFNLLSVIEGRILNDGAEQVDRVSGVVTIALPQSCDNLLFSDPDSIILCGNQPDMIRRALDIGVQCIILCQTDVDPAWLENAGKTCVISTPLDASRVARLVYQAIPISRPCNTEDLVSFHLDDYIDDVREVVLESRYRCYPVLDENEKVVGTLSRYHLLRPRRKRVVLVDADLRRSVVNAQYGLQFEDGRNDDKGLSHFLAGMVGMEEVIYQTDIPGALMVPVGRDVPNPLALLSNHHFKDLLDALAQRVDYVLVDAAPVGVVIDAAEIAKSCDGTLIAVQYNDVRRQELLDVKQQIEQSGCPILGTVLNQVDYDSYLSRKYYYRTYGKYGYYNRYYKHKHAAEKK